MSGAFLPSAYGLPRQRPFFVGVDFPSARIAYTSFCVPCAPTHIITITITITIIITSLIALAPLTDAPTTRTSASTAHAGHALLLWNSRTILENEDLAAAVDPMDVLDTLNVLLWWWLWACAGHKRLVRA